MAECELTQTCPFFNEPTICTMSELVKQLKTTYCLGDNTKCARFGLYKALGRKVVPKLMLPNQHDWARQILRDNKSPQ
jgi:hypothetical protein